MANEGCSGHLLFLFAQLLFSPPLERTVLPPTMGTLPISGPSSRGEPLLPTCPVRVDIPGSSHAQATQIHEPMCFLVLWPH